MPAIMPLTAEKSETGALLQKPDQAAFQQNTLDTSYQNPNDAVRAGQAQAALGRDIINVTAQISSVIEQEQDARRVVEGSQKNLDIQRGLSDINRYLLDEKRQPETYVEDYGVASKNLIDGVIGSIGDNKTRQMVTTHTNNFMARNQHIVDATGAANRIAQLKDGAMQTVGAFSDLIRNEPDLLKKQSTVEDFSNYMNEMQKRGIFTPEYVDATLKAMHEDIDIGTVLDIAATDPGKAIDLVEKRLLGTELSQTKRAHLLEKLTHEEEHKEAKSLAVLRHQEAQEEKAMKKEQAQRLAAFEVAIYNSIGDPDALQMLLKDAQYQTRTRQLGPTAIKGLQEMITAGMEKGSRTDQTTLEAVQQVRYDMQSNITPVDTPMLRQLINAYAISGKLGNKDREDEIKESFQLQTHGGVLQTAAYKQGEAQIKGEFGLFKPEDRLEFAGTKKGLNTALDLYFKMVTIDGMSPEKAKDAIIKMGFGKKGDTGDPYTDIFLKGAMGENADTDKATIPNLQAAYDTMLETGKYHPIYTDKIKHTIDDRTVEVYHDQAIKVKKEELERKYLEEIKDIKAENLSSKEEKKQLADLKTINSMTIKQAVAAINRNYLIDPKKAANDTGKQLEIKRNTEPTPAPTPTPTPTPEPAPEQKGLQRGIPAPETNPATATKTKQELPPKIIPEETIYQARMLAAKKYNLDENLLKKIAKIENEPNNINKLSDTGAIGLMQMLPSTKLGLAKKDQEFDITDTVKWKSDPEKQYMLAGALLRENKDHYDGIVADDSITEVAVLAYSQGTKEVNAAIRAAKAKHKGNMLPTIEDILATGLIKKQGITYMKKFNQG